MREEEEALLGGHRTNGDIEQPERLGRDAVACLLLQHLCRCVLPLVVAAQEANSCTARSPRACMTLERFSSVRRLAFSTSPFSYA